VTVLQLISQYCSIEKISTYKAKFMILVSTVSQGKVAALYRRGGKLKIPVDGL